jgi:septum formation protein
MMNLPSLILASASPRRAELMRQLELPFEILPATVEEIMHDQLTSFELAQVNAYRKARSVAKKHPDALVIGMDTVVALGTTVYGKPRDRSDAERILRKLQGKTHQVVTGVCLLHLRSHHQKVFTDITDVTFRSLGSEQIRHYLSKINPLDKAGAYAIQEHGDDIVRTISGSFSNVVGLPLERLRDELTTFDRVLLPA